MYILMSLEENRVLCEDNDSAYLSGQLGFTISFQPIFYKYKWLTKIFHPNYKVIKCKIEDLQNIGTKIDSRNYDYEWLRLKGTKKFFKVWIKGNIPSNSSMYFRETGEVMIKGIGIFPLKDFEIIYF